MSVGTGTLGFASGLRTFRELAESSAWTKRVLVEARPALMVTAWSVHSGSTYVATVRHTFMGTLMAVTGVRHGLSPAPLRRAETLSDCIRTPGAFYYDPAQRAGRAERWDDRVSRWDLDVVWDRSPRLYVHLPAGASPLTTHVAAELSFWFSAAGDVIPDLGDERLINGGFEFTSGGTPDGWNASTNGESGSIALDAAVLSGGVRSVRLTHVGGMAGRWDDGLRRWNTSGLQWDRPIDPVLRLRQPVALRTGAISRLSGAYRTGGANDPAFAASVRLGVPGRGEFVGADGFRVDGGHLVLEDTKGAWRRFVLEFLEWTDSDDAELELRALGQGDSAGAPSGVVWFDDVRLQRVWRYVFAAPRLADVPASRQGSRDVYFGGKTVGGGTLRLINADGQLEPQLAQLIWEGTPLRVLSGGDFASGERLLTEEYRPAFSGLVDTHDTDDESATLDLRDAGDVLNIDVPQDTYTEFEFPDLAPGFAGRIKALFFGPKTNISGVPVSRNASGYRVYELCGTAGSPSGIKAVSAAYAYVDTRSADDKDPSRRVTLVAGVDYAVDLRAARVGILTDVRLHEVRSDRNVLDFDEGGAALAATLTPGFYIPKSMAAHAQARIRSVGASDHTVSYDEATHKFRWARSGGPLNLRVRTGASRAVSAWSLLGFMASEADRTGATAYDGEEAVFIDADREHVVRVDAVGLADDAAGTFTGVPGAPIQVLSDIVRYVVTVLARRPDAVDEFSFRHARTAAPQLLGLYLRDRTNLRNVLDALETSCGSDIVVDGDGRFYVTVADDTVPPDVVQLFDRDFLSFRVASTIRDVLHHVTVNYDQDPSTGRWLCREATNEAVPLQHKRSAARTFDTYLTSIADVVARTAAIAAQGGITKRLATVEVKGKLTTARVGTKVQVWRSRGVDRTGALDGVLFRVLSIEKTPLDAVAKATLLEV